LESAVIVSIIVATLALFFGAAALPRSLLTLAFFTVVATIAVVIVLEIAPTESQTDNSAAVVLRNSKPVNPR
jgi:hypothetical protein